MASFNFATIKNKYGDGYHALIQSKTLYAQDRSLDIAAEKTGFKAAKILGVFRALAAAVKEVMARGSAASFDDVVTFRTFVKGKFDSLRGPWVKSENMLIVRAITLDGFKNSLAGSTAVNNVEGFKPTINTVFDENSGFYDLVSYPDEITIAGTNLTIDTTKDDEYVAFVDSEDNQEYKCTILSSAFGEVKVKLASNTPCNVGKIVVYTRCGMGSEYGVKSASRQITVA